jgi:hypothetical protein
MFWRFANPTRAGLILALSLPADESRPIGFETASVKILRRVKLGSGLCFTEMTQFNFGRTMPTESSSLLGSIDTATSRLAGHFWPLDCTPRQGFHGSMSGFRKPTRGSHSFNQLLGRTRSPFRFWHRSHEVVKLAALYRTQDFTGCPRRITFWVTLAHSTLTRVSDACFS